MAGVLKTCEQYTQNIRPNWNFNIMFSALNTNVGYYDPQPSSVNNTTFNSWYKSPNGHYMVIVGFVNNTFKAQENGGIQSGFPISKFKYKNQYSCQLWEQLTQTRHFTENFISAR